MAGEISIGGWARALLLVWLMGGLGGLQAQNRPMQFEFTHIQEKDGLSFNSINCFLQDRDGFLWIGTFDGLNRYDGNRFTVFKHNPANRYSLLSNMVYDLCEDQQGNLWMAVDNGISCYHKATGRFENITSVNLRNIGFCYNILCDRNGDIWFTSFGIGLHRYQAKTGRLQHFPYNPAVAPLTASSRINKNGMVLDPLQNGIWLADERGMHYFDIDQQRFFSYQHNPLQLPILTNHYVSALSLDGNDLIFADNDAKQIIRYSLPNRRIVRTISPVIREPSPDGFEIATLFVDRQHNIWASSWNHAVLHIGGDTDQVTELTHDDAKPTSIGAGLFWEGWQHPDGSVWLGTINGISQTNPSRAIYSVYDVQRLFPALTDREGITRLQEDADGTWWLGTHLRGLLHYNPQTDGLTIYKLPDEPEKYPYGGYVAAIVPYGDDLYVGSNIGFSRLNKRTNTVQKIALPTGWLRSTSLQCAVLFDDQVWIGNDRGEVFSYSPQSGQWRRYPVQTLSKNPETRVVSLLTDSRGNLWAHVSPEGFARLDKQNARFVVERPADNTRYNVNAGMAMRPGGFDQEGNIWVPSIGFGLWRYNPDQRTFDNWTESDGLGYDRALSALPDQFGHIWVGAQNKFSVFNPRQKQFVNFTVPYNAATLSYTIWMHQLKNGHILASLRGLLVEFFPEKIARQTASIPDKVLISQVSVGDSIWLGHRGLTDIDLNAEETSFTVHFAALTSATQTPFQYKYRLEGYDDDWKQAAGTPLAVYSRMPGGDYTFAVKGIGADGRETPVSRLAIHIDTLFYQTIWFWGLIAFILLGLVIGFLGDRAKQVAQLHDLQVQATRLARDKSEIQYQNLINHLNPHFLFNSLTSLNSLININPREASIFLRKLSIIYRYMLQNKDKELVTLDDELTFAQHYIDLQQSRFDDALQIRVDVPDAYRTRLIVPVTIQNLLENAIKHNTMDEDCPLVIQIYPEHDYLCIVNNLQRKTFVETSNKQGLASLKSMYYYLSRRNIDISETDTHFSVKVPLL